MGKERIKSRPNRFKDNLNQGRGKRAEELFLINCIRHLIKPPYNAVHSRHSFLFPKIWREVYPEIDFRDVVKRCERKKLIFVRLARGGIVLSLEPPKDRAEEALKRMGLKNSVRIDQPKADQALELKRREELKIYWLDLARQYPKQLGFLLSPGFTK